MLGQSYCVRARVVVFGQSDITRAKEVLLVQKWL